MKSIRFLSMLLIACMILTIIGICPYAASAKAVKHTITFDVQGIGETPKPITVNDGERYLYMRENDHGQNPKAEGYVFHCWVTTLDFEPDELSMSNTAYYDETPIHSDITLYAIWYKIVDEIEVEAVPPVAGDVIGTKRYETDDWSFNYQWPRPRVTVNTEGVRVMDYSWDMNEKSAIWLSDPSDSESTFKGTFELGKQYGVWMAVEPIFGYQFAEKVSITFNGKLVEKEHYPDYNMCTFRAPIRCVEKLLYLGDVDDDGEIMVTDATFLQRNAAQIELPFSLSSASSDVDGDGELTLLDATAIQSYLAGMSAPDHIGKIVY